MASRRGGARQCWAIHAYDRLYRWVNGLDRPTSQIGPVLCLKIRASGRTVRLADGTAVRRGEPIGLLHLNNERVVALHAGGLRPEAVGFEFRRQFLASLHDLAQLTDPGGPLARVQAFAVTTILHRGLGRLGFEPARGRAAGSVLVAVYQRALLASLRPAGRARLDGSIRHRARQLWISRDRLRARFRHPQARRAVDTVPPFPRRGR